MRACSAGVAQLVERNLAKVEVESSRLFSRSRIPRESVSALSLLCIQAISFSHGLSTLARWQSGYAAACKAVYLGSIPGRASRISY